MLAACRPTHKSKGAIYHVSINVMSSSDAKEEELCSYGTMTKGRPPEKHPRWRPSVFDFKSGGTCPTCQGTGKIPKGQQDELVALIPYNDKRLRPRRTCLYVILVSLLLLVIGGLLTAFLFPRNVEISIVQTNSTNDWVNLQHTNDSEQLAILEMQTQIKIKNSNFFPVKVNALNVTLSSLLTRVGLTSYPPFSINMRATKSVTVVQNATFKESSAKRVFTICRSQDWERYIFIQIMVLADYTYLSHSSDTVANNGQYVECDFVQTETSNNAI